MGRNIKFDQNTRPIMFQLDRDLWEAVVAPTLQRERISISEYFNRLVMREKHRRLFQEEPNE